jgi:hypothetical protein
MSVNRVAAGDTPAQPSLFSDPSLGRLLTTPVMRDSPLPLLYRSESADPLTGRVTPFSPTSFGAPSEPPNLALIKRKAADIHAKLKRVPHYAIDDLHCKITKEEIELELLFIHTHKALIQQEITWLFNETTGQFVKRFEAADYPHKLPRTLICIKEPDGFLHHAIVFNKSQDETLLGRGGNNKVKLGFDIEKDQFVALRTTISPLAITSVQLEAQLTTSIASSHIMHAHAGHLHTSHKDGQEKYTTIMDLCFCDLEYLYETNTPLTQQQKDHFAEELLEGLVSIHMDPRKIMQQDIKTENIFVVFDHTAQGLDESSLKYADFGYACTEEQSQEKSLACGSALYIHPYLFTQHSQQRDTWALGFLLAQLWDIELTPLDPLRWDGNKTITFSNYQEKLIALYDEVQSDITAPSDFITKYPEKLQRLLPLEGWLTEPAKGTREWIVWALLNPKDPITSQEALAQFRAITAPAAE